MKRAKYRLLGIGWVPFFALLSWLLFEKFELLDYSNQIHIFGLMAVSGLSYVAFIYFIRRHMRDEN